MSQIKLTNDEIKIVSGVGVVVVGGLLLKLFKYLSSKEEPEYVEDSDELNEVRETGSSEASSDDSNNPNDEEGGWKTGEGGKRSRKKRKNKSKKSRSKSKRRTKK
jgi:hypothetical protein